MKIELIEEDVEDVLVAGRFLDLYYQAQEKEMYATAEVFEERYEELMNDVFRNVLAQVEELYKANGGTLPVADINEYTEED